MAHSKRKDEKIQCPHCEKFFQRRGLPGHISFVHGAVRSPLNRGAEKAALEVLKTAVVRAPVVLAPGSKKAVDAVGLSAKESVPLAVVPGVEKADRSDVLIGRALDLTRTKKELETLLGEPGLSSLFSETCADLALKELRAQEKILKKDFKAAPLVKPEADEPEADEPEAAGLRVKMTDGLKVELKDAVKAELKAELEADEPEADEPEADEPEVDEPEADEPEKKPGWTNEEKILAAGAGAALLLVLSPKLREALGVLFKALAKWAPAGPAPAAPLSVNVSTGAPYENEKAAKTAADALAGAQAVAAMLSGD